MRHLRRVHDGLIGELIEVVAVERDVEHAARQLALLDACNLLRNACGNGNAARADTDEYEVLRALVLLDDLVCNAHERAPYAIVVHEDCLFPKFRHVRTSLSGRA